MGQDDLDIDPFESRNVTSVEDASLEYQTPLTAYFVLLKTITFLIACLVGISSNILLSVVILRFKRLQNRNNIYILNLALLGSLAFFTVACILLIDTFGIHNHAVSNLFFMITQTHTVILAVYVVISLMLVLDWFTSGFRPYLTYYYNRYCGYGYIIIYLLGIIAWAVSFAYVESHHITRIDFFSTGYIISLIILIIINVVYRVKSSTDSLRKSSYSLLVTNISVFSILPLFMYKLIIILPYGDVFTQLLRFLDFLGRVVFLCHPVIFLYVLKKHNRNFQIAFAKLLNKDMSDYENDGLNEDSAVYTYNRGSVQENE